jgi:anti-sigma regulatory factor (Ser/Thr protein kinase)
MDRVNGAGAVYIWEGKTKKGFLGDLFSFVKGVGKALRMDEKDVYEVQMAVGEAAANCQEHSYKGKRGKLQVKIECNKDELRVQLTDWGKGMNEENLPVPHIVKDLDKLDLEGLGVLMMRKTMDEVKFSRKKREGENKVTMKKKIH